MINNEWERSLDELNRTIQDAIDHQNYGRLNQNVTDTIGRAMEGLSRGLRNGIRYGSDAMNAAADNFAQRQRQAGNTPPFHNQGTGSAGGFTQNQGAGSAGGFAQDQRTGTAGNSVHRGGILYLKGTAIKVGGIFLAITGYLGMIVTLIIHQCGTNWIDIVLPTAAMGPVVALIGLELAGSAASTAGLLDEQIDMKNVIVFLVTLGVAVFGQILFRGFLSVIPILIAIIAGYAAAAACGILDFTAVKEAAFFALPNFQAPKFNLEAILTILPALLLVTSEHIGHQIVTSKIVGKDLLKDPGLHRSLFADFFSTTVSGCLGSVPTTTYGENIGVMAMTKVYSVQVIGGAAVLSICCSFLGKLAALINTIPGPVIGGISFLLYGMIGTSGLRMLVDNQVDYSKSRNLALTSVVFIVGLSGIALNLGNVKLTGMVLACVVAMALSLIFYILDKLHLTNDL